MDFRLWGNEKDMLLARQIQHALLPGKLPQVDGYRFYACYEAALAVGGDYYDCFLLSDDKVCISFGDVAGRGVPGALVMSRLSTVVQNVMSLTDDVSVAIQRVNNQMSQSMVEAYFVTCILGVIDLKKHVITLANAGHMSPLIKNPDGSIEEFSDDMIGVPLGIMEGFPYQIVERKIEPGEIFTLITDGVDEAMDPEGGLYSRERVVEFLKNGSTDPAELGRGLLADVRSHASGRDQSDDIAIMMFGRT